MCLACGFVPSANPCNGPRAKCKFCRRAPTADIERDLSDISRDAEEDTTADHKNPHTGTPYQVPPDAKRIQKEPSPSGN
ncbi:hypothetical protein PCASD_19375 [Puccinia coronata f. sp. avenae]|uniref:Uncharacterized protein n=1 Tax=Puccinia coronata f. sp. avenae TaxID=200324 RepID=A0A2N5SNK2_9BASI|nr:hypothetical protein PCASD_19375 [Puccinia coronata f. sp. avenae]